MARPRGSKNKKVKMDEKSIKNRERVNALIAAARATETEDEKQNRLEVGDDRGVGRTHS